MRIGLLSDIHANREAFDACLEAVDEATCDRLVVLGDLVGYGPDPVYVLDRVRELAHRGALVVRGNHDDYAVQPRRGMSERAKEAIDWTHARLDADAKAYLAALPLTIEDEDRLYVHASAADPANWTYVDDEDAAAASFAATRARLILCGHTHVPSLYHSLAGRRPQYFRPLPNRPIPLSATRRYLLVLGAVGQPRDRNPNACWGLLDTREKTVAVMRQPYDVETTMRKINDAGLPEWLARRLAEGR
ncbi:metallophosphoesterase family protein [Prosthecomicrobium sp. N25]|uniref:metallophosphoesterase family protein n=1 Tax=Prosthecomicrobium sp. N25 TaxID=3129254 RepID=UPI0030775A34